MTHADFLKGYPMEYYYYFFDCDSCDLTATNNGYRGSITYRWIIRWKRDPKIKTQTCTETITGEFSNLTVFAILDENNEVKVCEMVDLENKVLPFYNQNYGSAK